MIEQEQSLESQRQNLQIEIESAKFVSENLEGVLIRTPIDNPNLFLRSLARVGLVKERIQAELLPNLAGQLKEVDERIQREAAFLNQSDAPTPGVNWAAQLGSEIAGERVVCVDNGHVELLEGFDREDVCGFGADSYSDEIETWESFSDLEGLIPIGKKRIRRRIKSRRRAGIRSFERDFMAQMETQSQKSELRVNGNAPEESQIENTEYEVVIPGYGVIQTKGSFEQNTLREITNSQRAPAPTSLSRKLFGKDDPISLRRTNGLIKKLNRERLSDIQIVLIDGVYTIIKA